jgi:integrase/recombinase XerC
VAKITRFHSDSSPIAKAIALWLEDKPSAMTRREYEKDLRYFFEVMSGQDVSAELVSAFLNVSQSQANAALMSYKGVLRKRGLAPTTINRKISAVKSFVSTANRLGLCQYSLKDAVSSEKLKPYRDTSGIPLAEFKKVLALCDLTTLKGKRDKALLMLLWSNALRRNEVSFLDIGDFVPSRRILWVKGKGAVRRNRWICPLKLLRLFVIGWQIGEVQVLNHRLLCSYP